MKKLIFILVISTFFFSCKKKRTFHITAKNAVTGEPYPGLSYEIRRSWSGPYENHYKSVESGFLDKNGEVYFTKRLHKNSSYSISVAPPPNTCYINDIGSQPKGETNFEAKFEFAECAYFKLSIHNINCTGDDDNFKLFYMGRQVKDQGDKIVGALSKQGSGCFLFEQDYYSSVPMGEIYWKWEVTRNNITNVFYDTVYLSPGEHKVYEINY